MTKASDNAFPKIIGAEGAAPGTPAAATAILYVKADGLWYSKDDAGVETLVSGGDGGGAAMQNLFVGTYNPHLAEDSIGPNVNNAAWYIRFRVDGDITITKIIINILTSAGNIDLGIFADNSNTPGTLLVSTGSTASPGTGERSFTVSSTALTGGTIYYAGLAVSSSTFRLTGEANVAAYPFSGLWHLHGYLAAGFPLASDPAAITWEGAARGWPCILFNV